MSACASCGADNRAGRKFCARCGTALGIACPACATANQPDELFCGECGSPLAAPAPSPSPETVLVSGERKQITVLFADVAGSMDLQERLDAEVWAQIMGRFVSILAEGVRRFGGTVDKFTGDGIMALFGAPVAQEDHARRACHAAWRLTRAIGEHSEELRKEHGVELAVRLGLNSGEVVVGPVGDDVVALGHTVSLAQRMEAMAEPGRAYLTERTARLVEGWFQLEDLGPKSVRGAREALRVFVLGGPAPSAPTLRGGRTVGASPLVGRDRELAVLEDALAKAAEGHAQVVGEVGEAGVGKSRLCDEFARSAASRGMTVRRTAGVSHASGVPLVPILSLMRDYFEVSLTDNPGQAREKVRALLLDLDPALEDSLPLLYDFLEVPDPDRPAPKLAPEVRMRRIFEALRRITQRRSEREVLVLVAEDLHWFDPQSEAFLERIIESFPGSRTLVVTNFRPEFAAPWTRHSYYRQLPVAPLHDEAVGEMLAGLLGSDPSLAPLLGFVLDRTGGNPFFVEEVVRSLVEHGSLAGGPGTYRLTRPLDEVEVPPSVQAVLAERIDRLRAEHKSVLQAAAVIGRVFPRAVLATVTERSDEALEDALGALRRAELLHQERSEPAVEYRFWHPLTQEVAYGTLLTGQRARLHAAVARAFIELEPERLNERAALLASHFEAAGEALEAARWHARAAGWELRRDLDEALRRWQTSLALLEALPETDEVLELGVTVRIRVLQYAARMGVTAEEVDRLATSGKRLAERLGDTGLLGGIIQIPGTAKFLSGQWRAAQTCFEEAAELVHRTDDVDRMAMLWTDSPIVSTYVGPLPEALPQAENVVTSCHGDHRIGMTYWGYSSLHSAMRIRAEILGLTGRLQEALPEIDRVLTLTREHGEPEMATWVISTYVRLADLAGELGPHIAAMAREAVGISEDTGNRAMHVAALGAFGIAQLASGRKEDAVAALTRGVEDGRRRGLQFEEGRLLAYLAQARLECAHEAEAIRTADEAVAVSMKQEALVLACHALLVRARVRRVTEPTGSDDAVLADIQSGLALAEDLGAATYEPFIHEELGRLHNDAEELREALRLYRQIGATGHVRRLGCELSMKVTR
jgi:class 3 adenylate cyclase/tetratricopeptide (TPR) repeat protein